MRIIRLEISPHILLIHRHDLQLSRKSDISQVIYFTTHDTDALPLQKDPAPSSIHKAKKKK